MSAFGGEADIDQAIIDDRSSATIFSGRNDVAMEQGTLTRIKAR
jgi:hypothetical protein